MSTDAGRITGFVLQIDYSHPTLPFVHHAWVTKKLDLAAVYGYLSQVQPDPDLDTCCVTLVKDDWGEDTVWELLEAPVGSAVFRLMCVECGHTSWSLSPSETHPLHVCKVCALDRLAYGGILRTEAVA